METGTNSTDRRTKLKRTIHACKTWSEILKTVLAGAIDQLKLLQGNFARTIFALMINSCKTLSFQENPENMDLPHSQQN